MRKLAEHKTHGKTPYIGLSDYLLKDGTSEKEIIIEDTNINNLHFIARGIESGQPATLLSSNRLQKLINSQKEATMQIKEIVQGKEVIKTEEKYDFILFDSPSIHNHNDGALLSMFIDGIILVIELGKTEKLNITKALQKFSAFHDKILGILVNKVPQPEYRVYKKNYDYFQNRKYLRK
jgi:Mrp family chromosome partitioning ATPase